MFHFQASVDTWVDIQESWMVLQSLIKEKENEKCDLNEKINDCIIKLNKQLFNSGNNNNKDINKNINNNKIPSDVSVISTKKSNNNDNNEVSSIISIDTMVNLMNEIDYETKNNNDNGGNDDSSIVGNDSDTLLYPKNMKDLIVKPVMSQYLVFGVCFV